MLTVASLTPLSYFFFPFLCGFFNLPQDYVMLLAPVFLVGPVVTAIAIAALPASLNAVPRIGVGAIAWIATVALIFMFPAGAKTWTIGFSTRFQFTKHPTQIQQWAVSVLDRYERGQLSTSTNAPYWAVGKEELDASEVPSQIGELWRAKPSIGIAEVTPEGWITAPSRNQPGMVKKNRCVAFSWYLTGILIGRPDFHSTWNPWYIREIAPGIYAYCGMK